MPVRLDASAKLLDIGPTGISTSLILILTVFCGFVTFQLFVAMVDRKLFKN